MSILRDGSLFIRSGGRTAHFDAPGRAIHVRASPDDSGFDGIMLASYTMESAECVRLVPDLSAGFRLTLYLENGIVVELGLAETQPSGTRLARKVAHLIGCTADISTGSAGANVPNTPAIPAEPVFAALIDEFRRDPSPDKEARWDVRSPHDDADADRLSDNANEPDRDDQAALLELLALAADRLPVATRDMVDP